MRRKEKSGEMLTAIVIFALAFCVVIITAGMVIGALGQDVSGIVESAVRVFGTELGICGVLKLSERKINQEREQAERRERARRERE